ncbi:hypothetical protein, partial [Endozoicomonas sp. ONNA2]|uniref:hypothetical protein n=1 Tax=Endozoicomonas sp. ONNA2 TaxID=2828741 RepID=UPI0021481FB4
LRGNCSCVALAPASMQSCVGSKLRIKITESHARAAPLTFKCDHAGVKSSTKPTPLSENDETYL